MNKTLLLVICDFLLLNLLALTRWEKAEPSKPAKTPVQQTVSSAKTVEQDMVETMRLSLADEEKARADLAAQLAERERKLASTEGERENIAKNLEATKSQAGELDRKLRSAVQEAEANQARLAQLQRDLDLRNAEAARQKEQLAALESAQRSAQEKIEGLSVAVKVAEQEKVMLKETASTLRQQVETERQERQKVHEASLQLAQGVGQLAEKSGELSREIRENRPINANVLYNDFLAARVQVKIRAERENSFLGNITRSGNATSVLVTDGTNIYALFHIDESPFGFQDFAANWKSIHIELSCGERRVEAKSMAFISVDPRIIALPLDATQAAALGAKVYSLTADTFRFPEAMLVSRGGGGYGECAFKLDPKQPAYVRMDNRLFKRLLGDFTPSRGDLVFSKSGEVLGLMVSSSYCGVVNALVLSRSIQLGDTSKQETSKIFSEMEARMKSLPFLLQ